jgi:cytochrome P450
MNANSVTTTYVAMLRIIIQPGLIASIRTEISQSGYPTLPCSQRLSLFPASLPLLRSTFWESLRMYNVGVNIREVRYPTEFPSSDGKTYNLKVGGVVTIPSGTIHMDPTLHPSPEEFHPHRFMDKSLGGDGENASKTLKAFGGKLSCNSSLFRFIYSISLF